MVVFFKQMMYVSLNSAAAVRSILASGNGDVENWTAHAHKPKEGGVYGISADAGMNGILHTFLFTGRMLKKSCFAFI